jgi:mRNA interferase MazF
MKLDRGTVVLVELDPTVGREQRGVRPCIAVSDPAVNADQRFPLIAVVPVAGTLGEGSLYPELAPGKSGLTKTSYALIDHLRSIDKRRVRRVFGRVAKGELAAVEGRIPLPPKGADRLAYVAEAARRSGATDGIPNLHPLPELFFDPCPRPIWVPGGDGGTQAA